MVSSAPAFRLLPLLILFGTAVAPTAQASSIPENIDPKAQEVLTSFTKTLAAAKTVKVDYVATMQAVIGGQEKQTAYKVWVERPKKISFESLRPKPITDTTLFCDGTTLTIYREKSHIYSKQPAPPTIDNLAALPEVQRMAGQELMILCPPAMWGDNPYEALMDGVTSGVYLGKSNTFAGYCHHVRFFRDDYTWEAYIAPKPPYLLVSLKYDERKQRKTRPKSALLNHNAVMELQVNFSHWELNKDIPAEAFEFSTWRDDPQLVANATDYEEPEPTLRSGTDAETRKSPLVGTAAPSFDMPTVQGRRLNDRKLTGTIVVLDFWQTFCPPCRQSLVTTQKVAAKFKGKPVRFFTVNIQEPVDRILGYMEEHELRLETAMDERHVSRAYKVSSVPSTVVIDSSGQVAAVHSGLTSNYEDLLTSQVEALLEAESPLSGK